MSSPAQEPAGAPLTGQRNHVLRRLCGVARIWKGRAAMLECSEDKLIQPPSAARLGSENPGSQIPGETMSLSGVRYEIKMEKSTV